MSTPTLDFCRAASRLPNPPPWAAAEVLLMTACDQAYLSHALALVNSLDVFAPGTHLLLHLVNPNTVMLDRVAAVASACRSVNLHVSTEKVALPTGSSKAAYYASARFFRMSELLNLRTSVPILAIDADALAVNNLSSDFSDKPEAEICIRQRPESKDERFRVAAGAVWARSTPRSRMFFDAVVADLTEAFASGNAEWFVDQKMLGRHVEAGTAEAKVRNLKTKFADWLFSDDAVFWMGKGERKRVDLRYLILRDALDADPQVREAGRQLFSRYASRMSSAPGGVIERVQPYLRARRGVQAAIFLPRLDLPWKPSGLGAGGMPPTLAVDTLELRMWWKRFTVALAHALTTAGASVRLVELPAWEIGPERVDAEDVDLAFIPHRTRLDFGPARTAVWFFMQEYFRPVFVLDREGWGAASSVYPVDAASLPPAVLGAWDAYCVAMANGSLSSKFMQSPQTPRARLVEDGVLPSEPFAFMPMQVPHDQSIERFSDVGMADALAAAVDMARELGIPLVAKEHPANRGSMRPFRERFGTDVVHWTDAHVYDVLRSCTGVVTVNSGVGFEALIANRPVVCIGRAEYDAVVGRAMPQALTSVWQEVTAEPDERRRQRYARFVDWFLGRHAVDLSRPATSSAVLQRKVREALADATSGAVEREARPA